MKKSVLSRFRKINSEYYTEQNRKKPYKNFVLTISVTNSIVMNVILLRFSRVIADIEKSHVVFTPHIKTSPRLKKLIYSFKLKKIVLHFPVAILMLVQNFINIVKILRSLSTGEDVVNLNINGIDIGKHLYDFILIRKKVYTIEHIKTSYKASIIYGLYLYYLVQYQIRKYNPIAIIMLDNVYLEGIIFEIAKKNKIKCYTGFDINLLTLHKYQDNLSYSEHCRTPDKSLLAQECISSFRRETLKFLKDRFSGEQNQHDAKRSFSKKKTQVTKPELVKLYKLDSNKPIVLVLPHIFMDAPHAYPAVFFTDYYDWFIQTLSTLNSLNNSNVLVKEHPSARLYGEQGLVKRLVDKLHLKNVHLISSDINSFSLMNSVDAMITCGGTSGMEYAYKGVTVIIASHPPYYNLGFVYSANTREEYFNLIKNHDKLQKPSVEKQLLAGYTLYLVNYFYGIPKDKLGLSDYVVNLGEKIDVENFLNTISSNEAIRKFESELKKQIQFMENNQFKNLYDMDKIKKLCQKINSQE